MRSLLLSACRLLPLVCAVEWWPGDACPTEIHTRIGADGDFKEIEAVHAAMLTCTNITTLILYEPYGVYTDQQVLSLSFHAIFPLTGVRWERYASAPEILILHDYYSHWNVQYEVTELELRWLAPWYLE